MWSDHMSIWQDLLWKHMYKTLKDSVFGVYLNAEEVKCSQELNWKLWIKLLVTGYNTGISVQQ